jgi:hypothetical protein
MNDRTTQVGQMGAKAIKGIKLIIKTMHDQHPAVSSVFIHVAPQILEVKIGRQIGIDGQIDRGRRNGIFSSGIIAATPNQWK